MVLLYITNGINGPGGLERVLSVKATVLADDYDYRITIATLNEEKHRPFYQFSSKVKFKTFYAKGNPLNYLLQYKKSIKQLVKEVQPDVISVCDDGLKGFLIPKFISKKIPVIYESHASQWIANRGKGMSLNKKIQHGVKQILGNGFSYVIFLTQGNLKEWSLKNTMVIPNPLSFYPEKSSELKNKKVIAVGSHSYNKGYDRLIEIWNRTEKDFPDWSLEIYGKSANRKYENLANELNLKSINFYSPVSNIEDQYLDASVFVLPSRSEGFGMVIIEAMACGLPVVSFDCPNGPADIIKDDEDGFLIENGNIEQFSEKLKLLIRDFELRKKMGRAGKENVKRYLPNQIVSQWNELFLGLKNSD